MSDLHFTERRLLENLFQMGSGYVLNFNDRTFQEFVVDAVRIDIDEKKYCLRGDSKAKRLRAFWELEPNHVVGELTQAMVSFASTLSNVDQSLIPEGLSIAARLISSAPVAELDAVRAPTDDRTFDALAKAVKQAIEHNEPASGLDRLHTYTVHYVRSLCAKHAIPTPKETSLHGLFGAYVKHLKASGLVESQMTERILKSSISNLEAFNDVRNNRSFAHANELLSDEESLLIYNHVCASIRFVQSLEARPTARVDDLPN
jgi:hypothetical protein